MNAKTATVRLYVALVTLITTIVALVSAVLRLAAALVARLAARVERQMPAVTPQAPQKAAAAPAKHLRLVPAAPAESPATGAPSAADRLTTALTGMGFKAPDVRRFVTSLGGRVDKEPLEALIVAGLAALSKAA